MASSFTDSLILEKPATGEQDDSWGDTLRSNWDKIDDAVAGFLAKSVAGGSNVNLTAAESLNMVLSLTGTITANIDVVVPTVEKIWFIENNTAGAFTVTVKTSGGTGVVVPQGEGLFLRCDGTNVVAMVIGASGYEGAGTVVTTEGDIIVAGEGGVAGRLAIGAENRVLTSNGTTAIWAAPAAASPSVPANARMLFQSTAAPTGWTKDTTHNNKALRLVNGAVSSGGATGFTSVFGSSISTGSYALTTSDIPSHAHSAGNLAAGSNGAHSHSDNSPATDAGPPNGGSGYAGTVGGGTTGSSGAHTHSITGTTGAAGSGGGHAHTMSMNLQYVDFIIAVKD